MYNLNGYTQDSIKKMREEGERKEKKRLHTRFNKEKEERKRKEKNVVCIPKTIITTPLIALKIYRRNESNHIKKFEVSYMSNPKTSEP